MQKDKDANKINKMPTEDISESKPYVTPMVEKDAPNAENVPIPGSFEDTKDKKPE